MRTILEVFANVRYWEDAKVNGEPDVDGKIPCRVGNCWCPHIDVNTGEIVNWEIGTTAEVHYKVCDSGEYFLDGGLGARVQYRGHYVPDFLCPNRRGYGDYVIMKIGLDGIIQDWYFDFDSEDWKSV